MIYIKDTPAHPVHPAHPAQHTSVQAYELAAQPGAFFIEFLVLILAFAIEKTKANGVYLFVPNLVSVLYDMNL